MEYGRSQKAVSGETLAMILSILSKDGKSYGIMIDSMRPITLADISYSVDSSGMEVTIKIKAKSITLKTDQVMKDSFDTFTIVDINIGDITENTSSV